MSSKKQKSFVALVPDDEVDKLIKDLQAGFGHRLEYIRKLEDNVQACRAELSHLPVKPAGYTYCEIVEK